MLSFHSDRTLNLESILVNHPGASPGVSEGKLFNFISRACPPDPSRGDSKEKANRGLTQPYAGFAGPFPPAASSGVPWLFPMDGLMDYLPPTAHTHIVIGTHGNLLTLILNHFDPGISHTFWQNLTMPDIYRLDTDQRVCQNITRMWKPLSEIY